MGHVSRHTNVRSAINATLDPAALPLAVDGVGSFYPPWAINASTQHGGVTIQGQNTFRVKSYEGGDQLVGVTIRGTANNNADWFMFAEVGVGLWPPPGNAPLLTVSAKQKSQGATNEMTFAIDTYATVRTAPFDTDYRISFFASAAGNLTPDDLRSFWAKMGRQYVNG